jgi:hypothetical protein
VCVPEEEAIKGHQALLRTEKSHDFALNAGKERMGRMRTLQSYFFITVCYSCHDHLLSTYCVPGTVVAAWNTAKSRKKFHSLNPT